MFLEDQQDLRSRGSEISRDREGIGSARWFRWLTSRKQGGTQHISQYKLGGDRTTGPIRVIVLQDRSGSMEPFAQQREEVLQQLFTWAPDTLQPTDEIAIVDFSDRAGVALPPTPVSSLESAQVVEGAPSGGTLINPAMYEVLDLIDETRTNWVLAISDGEIFDQVTEQISRLINSPEYGGTVLINPAYAELPGSWAQSFPDSSIVQMVGFDAGGVAVSIGMALGTATGQGLVRGRVRPRPRPEKQGLGRS